MIDEETATTVEALVFIGRALQEVAEALRYLGNGNAATSMGAIEAMSMKIGESIDSVGSGLCEVAGAIRGLDLEEGFSNVAQGTYNGLSEIAKVIRDKEEAS